MNPVEEPRFEALDPDRLRVEWGPVSLVLAARWPGETPPGALAAAGSRALEVLEELAAHRRLLALDVRQIRNTRGLPASVRALVDAARPFAEDRLTPLAAVAGGVADRVADFLVGQGAHWVAVSNGGDVAIRCAPGQSVRVGLVARLDAPEPLARIRVEAGDAV
ncbi:MAG: hypothetical protein ACYDA8_12380, partial [Deferrisomatales bacterium]